jgi:hypothetical protein
MIRVPALLVAPVLILSGPAVAQALPTPDDPIAYAMSAGPPSIAADATIMDTEGNILRAGTNDWTCIPMPGEPMCMDQQWMAWVDAYMNRHDEVNATAVGLAYMLRGDEGASNIDPYAEGPTPDNDWVVTGPHLMMIVGSLCKVLDYGKSVPRWQLGARGKRDVRHDACGELAIIWPGPAMGDSTSRRRVGSRATQWSTSAEQAPAAAMPDGSTTGTHRDQTQTDSLTSWRPCDYGNPDPVRHRALRRFGVRYRSLLSIIEDFA